MSAFSEVWRRLNALLDHPPVCEDGVGEVVEGVEMTLADQDEVYLPAGWVQKKNGKLITMRPSGKSACRGGCATGASLVVQAQPRKLATRVRGCDGTTQNTPGEWQLRHAGNGSLENLAAGQCDRTSRAQTIQRGASCRLWSWGPQSTQLPTDLSTPCNQHRERREKVQMMLTTLWQELVADM